MDILTLDYTKCYQLKETLLRMMNRVIYGFLFRVLVKRSVVSYVEICGVFFISDVHIGIIYMLPIQINS